MLDVHMPMFIQVTEVIYANLITTYFGFQPPTIMNLITNK